MLRGLHQNKRRQHQLMIKILTIYLNFSWMYSILSEIWYHLLLKQMLNFGLGPWKDTQENPILGWTKVNKLMPIDIRKPGNLKIMPLSIILVWCNIQHKPPIVERLYWKKKQVSLKFINRLEVMPLKAEGIKMVSTKRYYSFWI